MMSRLFKSSLPKGEELFFFWGIGSEEQGCNSFCISSLSGKEINFSSSFHAHGEADIPLLKASIFVLIQNAKEEGLRTFLF